MGEEIKEAISVTHGNFTNSILELYSAIAVKVMYDDGSCEIYATTGIVTLLVSTNPYDSNFM